MIRIHRLLDEACRLLEAGDEYAVAAFVGQGMAMLEARHDIPATAGEPDATPGELIGERE